MKNHGSIVSFRRHDKEQFAIMYDMEQTTVFTKNKKAFLRLVDDNYKPLIEAGKPAMAVVLIEKLTMVGKVD